MRDQYWKVSRAIIFLRNQFPNHGFVASSTVIEKYGLQNLALPSEVITREEGLEQTFVRIYTLDSDNRIDPILEEPEGYPFVIIKYIGENVEIKMFKHQGEDVKLLIDTESELDY